MRALVMGGTRFVGLRLVWLLSREGHDVALLNRGKTEAHLPSGLQRLCADRRDPDAVRKVLRGTNFDVVFDMTGYQVVNLEPVVELLNGRIEHYVFQSTCGVYGPSEIQPIFEDFPYRTPMAGISGFAAYEQDKVECEKFLFEACREKGFPVTIFRCPVIYGPENWMDDREASYFFRLACGRRILVPGNGFAINQFTHVDDLALAHLSVVRRKETIGQAYNIAGQTISVNGYIDMIAKIVGTQAEKIYLEPREVGELKHPVFPFSWNWNTIYSIQKAKEDFGFWPNYDLKSGLENSYQWWSSEKGIKGTKLTPGLLGHDVDLEYEDELIARHSTDRLH